MGKETSIWEKLELVVPGFHGYKKKELLREDDRLVRAKVAEILAGARRELERALQRCAMVNCNMLMAIEDMRKRLVMLEGKVKHAEAGYAGFFDRVKIKEKELEKLIEYDAKMIELAEGIRDKAGAISGAVADPQRLGGEVFALDDMLRNFEEVLEGRSAILRVSDMVQVIEWVNPGEDEIIWRYPNEVIKWGAQLVVHEYEVAVFMRDGKVYDVFGPGRHTLTTQNLPLLYKLVGGSNSPFKATVIFVSTKEFQGRYGGETQTRELAPIKYYGVYWFKVADPVQFLTEVVGGQSLYDTSDVTKFIRAYFNEGMMKHLSSYSIVDLFQNLDMVSTQVKVKLMEDFRRLGLELVDVKIEGVNTTDEWRQRLFWIMQTGNAQAVMQLDTAKQVAAELGKSGSASVGTGMVLIPPADAAAGPGSARPAQCWRWSSSGRIPEPAGTATSPTAGPTAGDMPVLRQAPPSTWSEVLSLLRPRDKTLSERPHSS